MPSAGSASPGYAWFKAAIFSLLAWNTAVFVLSGTFSEALDSAAWLFLLALFELETGFGGRFGTGRQAAIIRAARLAAAAAILAAATGYVLAEEWLDAVNLGLWIAVVALLELEVRRAEVVARHRVSFGAAAAVLYLGLAAMVVVWALRGEWYAAYDAALWIVAFATIEFNVLRGGQSVSGRTHA